MKRVVKTIAVRNGRMYVLSDNRRVLLFQCRAEVELIEHSVQTPILGKGRVIDKRSAVLLITFDQCMEAEINANDISGFAFEGDFIRLDGSYISMDFEHCMLCSDLDLTAAGQCRFELQCSPGQLEKLKVI